MVDDEKSIKITPIKNGTVIDHISSGQAIKVMRILSMTEGDVENIVSIAMNVDSSKGKKDIVKVEDREIGSDELNKISLIAPEATINIIRNYGVVEKKRVNLPDRVKEIVRCKNRNCISNKNEPVSPEFIVEAGRKVTLRCIYCNREMRGGEISDNLM